MPRRSPSILLGAATILAVACGGGGTPAPETPMDGASRPASTPRPDDSGPSPWEACYSTFTRTGDPETDLSRLVRSCGAMGGMQPVTEVRVAEQSSEAPVDRYTFDVPAAGTCYRVYAVGANGIEDLDLLLRSPSGAPVAGDVGHDAWPVLPPGAPLCVPTAGRYQLEVGVQRGAGRYALQVFAR